MKYVIPVTVDHETAAKILDGSFPQTATATRAKLAAIVEKKIAEFADAKSRPVVVAPVEVVEEKPATAKKTTKKGSKK